MRLCKFAAFVMAMLIIVMAAVPASASAGERLSVERQVYNYLTTELKLSTAAACGVLANIEHESNFQPTIYGDHGTSYGLCQWHNERFTALRGYCSALGLDYRTVEGQMAYLKYELGNNYTDLVLTLQSIGNTADGAYRAGYLWCVRFERPRDMEVKGHNRGTLAQGKYWNRYKNGADSLVLLPEPEPEPPQIEDVVEKLRQPTVSIPTPPAEKTVQGYEFPKPDFVYYVPWHLPKAPAAVTVQEAKLRWELPALAVIAAAALAVWCFPGRKPAAVQ